MPPRKPASGKQKPIVGPSAAQNNHDQPPRPATGPIASPSASGQTQGKGMPGKRPQIAGAADSVMGAPLAPKAGKRLPQAGAVTPKAMDADIHSESLTLGVDTQGGAAVPKQLDTGPRRRKPRK